MSHFIATHHDLLIFGYTALMLTLGYVAHKWLAKEESEILTAQLTADVIRLLEENESQREIIRQQALSQTRTSGNHPAGKQRHLVSVREVDTR